MDKAKHDELLATLEDEAVMAEYKKSYDGFSVGPVARALGHVLVTCGNLVYGEEPSYGKFKAVEVIARIPYQSWEVASYTLLTLFYSDEKKAIALSRTSRFSRISQDNETMHVVVLSQLARKYGEDGLIRHTLVPLVFSFFYAAASFLLYMVSPRSSLELNYLFENHAYSQYARFLARDGEALKKKPVMIDFLDFYGRHVNNEYELFRSICHDEIIHRNASAHLAEGKA